MSGVLQPTPPKQWAITWLVAYMFVVCSSRARYKQQYCFTRPITSATGSNLKPSGTHSGAKCRKIFLYYNSLLLCSSPSSVLEGHCTRQQSRVAVDCIGVARMAIYFIPCYSHIHNKYDFWHDFAGKGVLNISGKSYQNKDTISNVCQKIFKFLKGSHEHCTDMTIFEFENKGRRHLGFLNIQNFNRR